jgi:hypothetical protein
MYRKLEIFRKALQDSNVDVVSALLATVEFEYTKLQGIALM